MSEVCTKHHWLDLSESERCHYCQMKFSYWKEVKRAIDRGDINAEDWACKPHYHTEEGSD